MFTQNDTSLKTERRAEQTMISVSPSLQIARSWVVAAILVFLLLSLVYAYRRVPWSDEGWFASASLTLLHHGYLGTAVVEPTGTHLAAPPLGLDRYTYWVLPLYLLAQTVWFAIVGFTPFLMRLTSVVWGLAGLYAFYIIAKRLFVNESIARLCVCLLAADTLYFNDATLARMDMMAAALAFIAIALYLSLRERNFSLAVLGGSTIISLACFTHHQAILGVFALILISLHLDRRRLNLKLILLALVPGLLLAGAWSLYARERPDYFIAQIATNGSGRLAGYREPIEAVKAEIFRRYDFYGYAPGSQPLRKVLIVIPVLYFVGLAATLLFPALRRQSDISLVAHILCLQIVFQILFEGNKLHLYLVHVVPWFALLISALAIHICRYWRYRRVALAGLFVFVGLQLVATLSVVVRNDFPPRISPVRDYLLANAGKNQVICGSPELGIYIGFDNLVDDLRLGYYGSRKPTLIVQDDRYRSFLNSFQTTEPDVYRYINSLLARSELVLSANGYQVYRVKG